MFLFDSFSYSQAEKSSVQTFVSRFRKNDIFGAKQATSNRRTDTIIQEGWTAEVREALSEDTISLVNRK